MSPQMVQNLVTAIEMKDASTATHTWRVVLYALALAEAAGLSREQIARTTWAAALHDIGKIDIPDAILRKPGKLTDEEFAVMRQHTTLGHEMLLGMGETDPLTLELVRHHHERWDGKGYPDRLAGEDIPTPSRYFAVIDSFDAMTSLRPYRKEVGPEAAARAIAELKDGRGERYWPQAVDLFAGLYESGSLNWIMEYFNDGREMPYSPAELHSVAKTLRG